jgi:hypothetical protein
MEESEIIEQDPEIDQPIATQEEEKMPPPPPPPRKKPRAVITEESFLNELRGIRQLYGGGMNFDVETGSEAEKL